MKPTAPKWRLFSALAAPRAEITIRTREEGEKPVEKEFILLVGGIGKDGLTAVRNARFDYLFKVDAAFLEDLPKDAGDWKAAAPEKTT
ncbi:MAG: hypothetical protein NTW38_04915 [Candidatus Aminicenantes bacterium]|nr:hypothetical protein [Candidatus Aminicenantes bacterium]